MKVHNLFFELMARNAELLAEVKNVVPWLLGNGGRKIVQAPTYLASTELTHQRIEIGHRVEISYDHHTELLTFE